MLQGKSCWWHVARQFARDEKHFEDILENVPVEHLVAFGDYAEYEVKYMRKDG